MDGTIFANINSAIDSFFGLFHTIFQAVRDALQATGMTTLLILVATMVGGFYLAKKYPAFKPNLTWLYYGLLMFFIIKFV